MDTERIDISSVNRVIGANLAANYAWNAAANWSAISHDAMNGKPVCLSTLPHATGTPAVVVGSGPSLDKAVERIGAFPGAVFCGPSQVRTLDRWGRLPDYVVAIDSNKATAEQLQGPVYSHTILLTHQCIDPSVLDLWRWDRRFFRIRITDGDDLQAAAYPWLRVGFTVQGCTVNAAVQLAAWLGYSPIYLVGVDFGFPDGKLRATDWHPRGVHAYDRIEPRAAYDAKPSIYTDEADKNRRNGVMRHNGVLTSHEMMIYRLLLLAVWKSKRLRLWSCSSGILTELPWVDFDEVTEADYVEGPYPEGSEIDDIVDRATVPYGLYAEHGGKIVNAGDLCARQDELEEELRLVHERVARWDQVNGVWSRS